MREALTLGGLGSSRQGAGKGAERLLKSLRQLGRSGISLGLGRDGLADLHADRGSPARSGGRYNRLRVLARAVVPAAHHKCPPRHIVEMDPDGRIPSRESHRVAGPAPSVGIRDAPRRIARAVLFHPGEHYKSGHSMQRIGDLTERRRVQRSVILVTEENPPIALVAEHVPDAVRPDQRDISALLSKSFLQHGDEGRANLIGLLNFHNAKDRELPLAQIGCREPRIQAQEIRFGSTPW